MGVLRLSNGFLLLAVRRTERKCKYFENLLEPSKHTLEIQWIRINTKYRIVARSFPVRFALCWCSRLMNRMLSFIIVSGVEVFKWPVILLRLGCRFIWCLRGEMYLVSELYEKFPFFDHKALHIVRTCGNMSEVVVPRRKINFDRYAVSIVITSLIERVLNTRWCPFNASKKKCTV